MKSNEDFTPEDYELREAQLSYNHISKDQFRATMIKYGVDPEKAEKIWSHVCSEYSQAYSKYLLSQGSPKSPQESLKEISDMDPTKWREFAKSIELDSDVANDLFAEYSDAVTEVVETQIEQAELQAEQEAERQAQQEEAGNDDSPELTDSDLDTIIKDIRDSDAYWSDKASIKDHQRAVDALEKAMQMRANLIPRTLSAVDQYAKEITEGEKEALRDSYGISGDIYKSGQFSSSNSIPPSRSENDREGSVDTPHRDADRSSASGGRIEDAK